MNYVYINCAAGGVMKGLAYKRHHRQRIINRKKSIDKERNRALRDCAHMWYEDDNRYSKGKIHCSCWMCNTKTKMHGPSVRDRRNQLYE